MLFSEHRIGLWDPLSEGKREGKMKIGGGRIGLRSGIEVILERKIVIQNYNFGPNIFNNLKKEFIYNLINYMQNCMELVYIYVLCNSGRFYRTITQFNLEIPKYQYIGKNN